MPANIVSRHIDRCSPALRNFGILPHHATRHHNTEDHDFKIRRS